LGGLDKTIKKHLFLTISIFLAFIVLIGCIEITPRFIDDSIDDKIEEPINEEKKNEEEKDEEEKDEEQKDDIILISLDDYRKSPYKYIRKKISFQAWFEKIENNIIYINDHINEEDFRFKLPEWLDISFFTPKNPNGYNWTGEVIPIYNIDIDLDEFKLFDNSDESSIKLEDIILNPDTYDNKYITTSGIVNTVIKIDNIVAITDENRQYYDIYLNIPDSIDINDIKENNHYYFTGTIKVSYTSYSIRFDLLDVKKI
jgi:hypothetical protein